MTHCWPLRSASTSSPWQKGSWIAAKAGFCGSFPVGGHASSSGSRRPGGCCWSPSSDSSPVWASRSSACGCRRSSRPSTRPPT
ncbi:MAG: hypothetical protein MZV63_12165 [Marinilabiliales bacterium]|nr:hypothetical protein [Marinilabiliales bacterium]